MHTAIIQRIMGQFLMLFSFTLLPPILIDLLYQEDAARAFFYSYLLLLTVGFLLFLPVKNAKSDLRLRDGFVVVVLFWLVLGFAGALPFFLYENMAISIPDALFESISGLTTTGATVLVGLDDLPHSILFYRQELQWLGGMGIIVLAVAVMPMLGIGGMQLYKAEAPGPAKGSKLTPRIAQTAKALWYIYFGLTVVCALAYWVAGMSLFDAVAHSFSTVAIGGFSTHDSSIGFFDSRAIESVAAVFMVISGANFALHFSAFRNKQLRHYWADPEFKVYFLILAGAVVFCCAFLGYSRNTFDSSIWITGAFEVISIATTTGFSSSGYSEWPNLLPYLLLWLA
ncbi:MAG: potassium transporter, partial [Gammaproteobacteria bacterium]